MRLHQAPRRGGGDPNLETRKYFHLDIWLALLDFVQGYFSVFYLDHDFQFSTFLLNSLTRIYQLKDSSFMSAQPRGR